MSGERYDAVIVGGGLIGSALAVAFGRHGLSVALVEAAAPEVHADPGFDGRAYAIAEGSRALLAALGIWDAVATEAEPVRRITVTDRCTDPVPPAALHFDPAEVGVQALGWIVEDRLLRRALLEAVSAETGVSRIAPDRPDAVALQPHGAEIRLAETGLIQAPLVVACDGRRSALAREAGIRYLDFGYTQTGLVSAIEHDLPHDGVAHQGFFAGGPFAVLPMQGNRSSLVWSDEARRAEAVIALDDDAYLTEIRQRVCRRLGDIRLAGKRAAYPLGMQLATEYVRPRLAVVGDAAHGVHPIAGQGMNMGLRDVAALTEVVVEARRLGLDYGTEDILGGYQRWRRFDATAMALGMDALTRLFSTPSSPVQALRNMGLGLVSALPGMRRMFMHQAAGRTGDVPRLLQGHMV
ncbi:MAG: UbiH/UbiF/VisC/COQ6 family ubiquinone biosynthesis hydroxylase [Pseudomonadota bacterium]